MFLDAEGQPLRFPDAVRSGRSIGVPGLVAMLAEAHRDRSPWAAAWNPRSNWAEGGLRRLTAIECHDRRMAWLAGARCGPLFSPVDGKAPLPVGTRLRNPEYVATLRRIAREVRGVSTKARSRPRWSRPRRGEPLPGSLGLDDLKAYWPQRLEPGRRGYRAYLVCGMRPPSSGGIAVLSILGILEHFDLAASGSGNSTKLAPVHRGAAAGLRGSRHVRRRRSSSCRCRSQACSTGVTWARAPP